VLLFIGLYYDGRIDKQTAAMKIATTSLTQTAETHYSIVSQPDGTYLGFCSPANGTGISF